MRLSSPDTFPSSEKAELQRKFLGLIQGTNTVEVYNVEFSTLCRYNGLCLVFLSCLLKFPCIVTRIRAYRFSPHIANDPAERCARFMHGLNFDIQSLMANHPPVTHAEALDAARRAENIANRKKAAIALSTRRAAPTAPAAPIQSSARPQALRPNQTTAFKGPSSSAAPSAFGARPQVTCFHCKKLGHTQKECQVVQQPLLQLWQGWPQSS